MVIHARFMRLETASSTLHALLTRRATKYYYCGRNWRWACARRREAAWRRTRRGCQHLLEATLLAWRSGTARRQENYDTLESK